jgi:spore coat polysaccharide biosynthesis protein SpsF
MISAIIQARMTSSRLPGKVLKPLHGKPMLMRQIERVRNARRLHNIVVATSTDTSDDVLADRCNDMGVFVARGSLDDVLARFHYAADTVGADVIVRLTGDCPLSDPVLIDLLIKKYLAEDFDYVSNTIKPTFPDGLDVEVFSRKALETAFREARLPSEREHVTPFIKKSSTFTCYNLENDRDLSGHRWTVDEPEDFELISRIFSALYPSNPIFGQSEIMTLLDNHPDWSRLNSMIGRDEGYARSLGEDAQILQNGKKC